MKATRFAVAQSCSKGRMPYSFANLKMLDNAAYIAYTAIGSNGDSRDGDWADGIASLVSVTSFFCVVCICYVFIALLQCCFVA